MGKKNKRRSEPKSSSPVAKRSKTSGSPPPSQPKLPMINYGEMPLNHKKKFFINDDCGGSLQKYIELISWLRTMACLDGSVFEDIGNLNWSGKEHGYPLVEIEVITPEDKSSKFIICRMNLYLIAFYASNKWTQFNCGFELDNFKMLKQYDGRYTTKPWKHIGPKCMIDAVNRLNDEGPKCMIDAVNRLNDEDLSNHLYVEACEVFFVHLSEAARLYPVESLICQSLSPSDVGVYAKKTFEDEENHLLIKEDGNLVDDEDDVYSLVKGVRPIDSNQIVETKELIPNLMKNYSNMSKVWYVYALSNKEVFPISSKDVSRCHLKSRKSLRSTLATLSNNNLDKVLREWDKKSLRAGTEMSREVYTEMEKKVRGLQEQKRVFCPET